MDKKDPEQFLSSSLIQDLIEPFQLRGSQASCGEKGADGQAEVSPIRAARPRTRTLGKSSRPGHCSVIVRSPESEAI